MGKSHPGGREANEGKSPIEGYLNERFAIELAMGRVCAHGKSTRRLLKNYDG